jgi:hypothetical protein
MRYVTIKRTDGGTSYMQVLDARANIKDEIAKWAAASGLQAESFTISDTPPVKP